MNDNTAVGLLNVTDMEGLQNVMSSPKVQEWNATNIIRIDRKSQLYSHFVPTFTLPTSSELTGNLNLDASGLVQELLPTSSELTGNLNPNNPRPDCPSPQLKNTSL